MTRRSHRFTKSTFASSYGCPTCMTSLSHWSLVSFRTFSIAYWALEIVKSWLDLNVINRIQSEIPYNPTVISGLVCVLCMIVMHKKEIGPPSITYEHLEIDPRLRENFLQLQLWNMEEKRTYRQHACPCKKCMGAKRCQGKPLQTSSRIQARSFKKLILVC